MKYYYQHKIYCDLNYKELTSLVADYFVSNSYYDYGTEEKFKNTQKLYEGWDDKISFTVIIAKILMAESGSVRIEVENLKGKYSRGELKMEELPIKVRQRFKNMPNLLTIDLHRKWYKAQINLVEEITNKLKNTGFKTYDNSFNGQLLSIFDAIPNPEERIQSIHLLVQEYFKSNKLPEIDVTKFHSDFSLLIPNLSIEGIKALQTAEYLFRLEDKFLDFSPIIIEYCKLIEIELSYKVLNPLKVSFQNQTANSIVAPKQIKKLKSAIFSSDKQLELGTIAFLLESIVNSNLNDIISIKMKEQISALPFAPKLKTLINDIFHLTRNYRNRAAHKAILSKQDMIDCRKFVIGDGNSLGLISKIVHIG